MGETLNEMGVALAAATVAAARSAREGDPKRAAAELKTVMSIAAKLHQRMMVLAEMRDDAYWVAEVDRALARQRASDVPAVPGETPLPFEDPPKGRRGKGKSPA